MAPSQRGTASQTDSGSAWGLEATDAETNQLVFAREK